MTKEFKLGAMVLIILYAVTIFTTSSNTTQSVITVKPALPKSTVVLRGAESVSTVNSWIKKGYQVQFVSDGSSGRQTIVMVKY